MSTQISHPLRIAALAGVLVIALAGAALVLLRHHSPSATVTPPAAHRTTTPAKTGTPPAPAPARVTVVRPAVNPLLPGVLRAALVRRPLVVVGFYDPQARETSLALAEARAGALAAHAGFLPVSLLDDRVAGRLTALLPTGQLLPSPGILVYRRPGAIVYRFDGYLDREAVAQAVADVR